jgi:hypothetical protein
MQASRRRSSLAPSSALGIEKWGHFRVVRHIGLMGALLCALSLSHTGAGAQAMRAGYPKSDIRLQIVEGAVDADALIVATSHPNASYLAMARDMATALGDTAGVRLLPVAAGGGVENLRDLALLRSVHMAIVPANVLAGAKAIEAALGAALTRRVGYIAHLYAEEVHLLVGSGVGAMEGLRRGRVAVPEYDHNAEFTARDLFKRLQVDVEIVRMPPAEAIGQVRSGELSGLLLIGGKPVELVFGLPKDGRLRLLSMPFPATLESGYLPAAFRDEDYPTLVPPGLTVETVAVSAVLMANIAQGNEESSRRVGKFIPLFFGRIADLTLVGTHPKWKELNLATTLAGWNRLPEAEAWLREARQQQQSLLQESFEEFLRTAPQRGSKDVGPAERKKMFEQFIEWTRRSVGAGREQARP